MTKIRVNWTIEKTAYALIARVAKEKGKSISWIVENLIIKNLSDPIERLRNECRELQQQIVAKQDRISELEKMRGGDNV